MSKRTNYVKAKIDETKQNSKCMSCGDRDGTINHISEGSILAQKEYQIRHDFVGNCCKKLKFDHTTKWYAQTRILWYSLGFRDTNISSNPDQKNRLVIINKKKKEENLPSRGLCRLVGPQSEKQRKRKRYKYLGLAIVLKKAIGHEGNGDINCNCCAWNDPLTLDKGAGRIRNRRTSRDHLNYSIVEVGEDA